MKIKLSKQLWVLITLTAVVLLLVLSIHTRNHFDYTSGRVRTSQRIAWFTYDSQTEDTWLTAYAPEDTTPVWLSMHTNTPILSPAYYSNGTLLRNHMNTIKHFLDEMDADERATDYLAATFFKSLNHPSPGVDSVQSTLDGFQCLYREFPFRSNEEPVTLEELQAIIDGCFSITQPE